MKKLMILAVALLAVIGVGFTVNEVVLDENGNSMGTIVCADINVADEVQRLDALIAADEAAGDMDGAGWHRADQLAVLSCAFPLEPGQVIGDPNAPVELDQAD